MKKLPLISFLLLCVVSGSDALSRRALLVQQDVTAGGGSGDVVDSLRAWWKLDDGSGTTAVDNEGNTYPGTLEGSTLPTWTTGRIGSGALNFGNVDSSVNVGGTFLGTGDKTVSFWINPNSLAANGYVCGETKFYITLNVVGVINVSGDSGGNSASSAAFGVGASSWHFIAVTVTSAGTCNIYVNGALSGTANQATGTPSTSAFNFEWGNNINGNSVDAIMDDLRIYDRVLSAAEVDQIWDFYP